MFALANVMYLLAHKFAGLRTGGFAFASVLFGSLESFLLWHIISFL
ncbi:MAG TPA: hypothetical protein VK615_12045 [Candidatus Binatia bacterium]|nr:hypothetical protein [Candidatus Binatia bacterium]